MVQIGILGHGVVGSGVAELLIKNSASITSKAGKEIKVKRILDLREFPGLPYSELFTKDFEDIVNDEDIKTVVEVMGGISPAYEYTKRCLEAGKSVVTSNKELVAVKGAELLKTAGENNVNFLFEASVGGGIPIIRPLHQCLAANEIDEIAGILNGTTNYILTKMINEGLSFGTALKQAQELGYAEADPTADIEGIDSCRKICILASIAFGRHVYPDKVHTQGITKITPEDVEYADSINCAIKLIGRTYKAQDGKIFAMVSPAFIEKNSQLAGIDNVFNGILVKGDATGDVVFYGKGAGKFPTASAVIGDIIDCVKAAGTIKSLHWEDCNEDILADYREEASVMYIRAVSSCEEAAKVIYDLFGEVKFISRNNQPKNEYGFIIPVMKEKDIIENIKLLNENEVEVLTCIRKLDL